MIGSFLYLALALAPPEALADRLRQQGATDVRIERVQLDGDEPLEAIVRYILPETGAHAQVLDDDGRVAGKFNSWWNFVPADMEKLVELRETVDAGVKDLVVRTRGGGTEESRTTLEIFRLRKGIAVNVLTLKEQETAMEHPSGDVFTTVMRLTYSPGRVTARWTKSPGERAGCQLFVWNAADFRFDEQPCP